MSDPSAARLVTLDYIEAVLDVGWRADYHDYAFWRPDGPKGWTAYAICSDWFSWAVADAEEILPEDVPLLRECLADLLEVERDYRPRLNAELSKGEKNDAVATAYLPQLFASRKRRLRPMRCVYEDENSIGPRLAALFDAAGPEREDPEGRGTS